MQSCYNINLNYKIKTLFVLCCYIEQLPGLWNSTIFDLLWPRMYIFLTEISTKPKYTYIHQQPVASTTPDQLFNNRVSHIDWLNAKTKSKSECSELHCMFKTRICSFTLSLFCTVRDIFVVLHTQLQNTEQEEAMTSDFATLRK